jgi:ADP-ribosylation factor related protein 1
LGGQKLLRSIWKKYYAECHGLIYVIDGNNLDKYNDSIATLKEVLKHGDLQNVPLLIVINK